jgi:hypothetical protein
MRAWIDENRGGILAGLVSSVLFLYLLQPFLDLLVHLLVAVASRISTNYLDRIYAQAAHMETQSYSFLLFALLIAGLGGLVAGVATALLSVEIRKSDRIVPRTRISRIAHLCFSVFIVVLAFGILAGNYLQLSLISTFTRHMRVLGPYLNYTEERVIYSQWGLMENKADYDKVYIRLHKVAEDNKIKLPDNKIYSMLTI